MLTPASACRVSRVAVKYSPPTFMIEFVRCEKVFHNKTRFKRLSRTTNQEAVVEKILAGNADVLEPTQEEVSKIRHFVQLLLAHATSSEDDIHKCEGNTSFKHGQYTQPAAVDLLNLNGVSEEELQRAKDEMSKVFERTRILPGSTGYEYDKRVDFTEADETSNWDEDGV